METISPYIQEKIMRKVRFIWFSRKVLPILTLEILTLSSVAYLVAQQIFINKILENAIIHTFSRSPFMMATYFFRAFLNTEIGIQALLMASTIALFFFLKHVLKALRIFEAMPAAHSRNFSAHSRVI